jgi:hypothetical protein
MAVLAQASLPLPSSFVRPSVLSGSFRAGSGMGLRDRKGKLTQRADLGAETAGAVGGHSVQFHKTDADLVIEFIFLYRTYHPLLCTCSVICR